ncbi:glycogen debranching protein GlgX [Limnobaculum parvum]|uniref:Glycogen debranching protein GlgX n=1 Tax=Limnobaculum parvum TaxID=2172103 RepID=A0A2Y9TW01_9GAMM|nr:glycogen debranching protein GlgX [Limnobaculum parvum]AWH87604.1 glycogen debranching protein GlgX [Limnobaculum parvum]
MTVTLTAGSPYPLGSHFDGQGVNFALYSTQADNVELCLFNQDGEEQRIMLPSRTGDIWHGYLPTGVPGLRYGYRVHGPWDPQRGFRFNPLKLLIDPYSQALDGKAINSPLLNDAHDYPDCADSATVMPKSLVTCESYDWQNDELPQTPWSETIIYEAHVRGLTKTHPDIPAILRGTYAGIAHPVMIQYLKRLGITALELLPVQLHIDEPRLQQLGLTNYWGYNVLAPFAVEPSYWSQRPGSTPLSEFRDMVKILHQAGIEVILDVVFNHTAELDRLGQVLSLRGIDNASYYWLDEQGDYQNWTGCGNTLNLTQPAAMQWVLDCLRFWATECHVDGFRFDLASVLGRTPNFSADSPLLTQLQHDPVLSKLKLIAEPWDIGQNGYQLGHFPAPLAEWNDRFRDGMRNFWLQQTSTLGAFAHHYAASSSVFQHHQRLPYASVNKMTSHDGFTLRDLVSFNQKHNQANGEDNRDGNSNNYSDNHGTEGLDADEATLQRRSASARALLTTLLLSQGTPMLLAGDELGNSQQGNNNAYCQDSPLTWLNWIQADQALLAFTSGLIALRKQIPALSSGTWWTGLADASNGKKDVEWLNAQGHPMSADEWECVEVPPLQILLSGAWLVVINRTDQLQTLNLPSGQWRIAPPFSAADIGVGDTKCIASPRSISVLRNKN